MIFLFLQNPEWPCDEFFEKAARYRKMSSPRSSPQIQKYGGFVVCSRLAALSVPEKKIQNYSCCRLAISKIYRGQRIWILYSSKISIRSEYGLFRKQPVRHRCLCLSVDLLYFSKNHTQLQHESAEEANSQAHILFFLPPSDFNLKRYLADAMALPPASPLLSYSKISRSSLYVCGCLLPSQKRKMAELMICVFFQNAVLVEIWGY
jgi:hypothetical protein